MVLSALNHPEDIAVVYRLVERDIEKFGLKKDEELALKVQATLKLREGILKGYVAAGFPRVSALHNWKWNGLPRGVMR